jgi:hypothetical protein
MNDSNSRNSRKYQIYSSISLAIGVSTVALFFQFVTKGRFIKWYVNDFFPYALFIVGVALIAGIVLGKKGMNSPLKGVAIAGIGICSAFLIYWLLLTVDYILTLFWSHI